MTSECDDVWQRMTCGYSWKVGRINRFFQWLIRDPHVTDVHECIREFGHDVTTETGVHLCHCLTTHAAQGTITPPKGGEGVDVRNKTFTRGDYSVIVNYVPKTGAVIDAGLFHQGKLIEVTSDTDEIKKWIHEPPS